MDLVDKIVVAKSKSKRKRIVISIEDNAEVVVKIPRNTDLSLVGRFVESKRKWIAEQKNKKLEEIRKVDSLIKRKSVQIYGEELLVKYSDKTKKIIRTNREIVFPEKYIENVDRHIKKYLKELADDIITQRLRFYENATGIRSSNFSIKSFKRKWGSCNSKNELSFNFRLIMLKPEIIDYVIIHELCHIREFNHSSRFWSLVVSFDKNAKVHRDELKSNSLIATLY